MGGANGPDNIMDFGNIKALFLLFLVPGIIIPIYFWCFTRKARALRILASTEMLKKINASVSFRKQILKAVLITAGFVFIILALTEPRWNPQARKIKRRGRDIVILLDTSRSMLAEDIKPSRLEKSKLAIMDLLEVLQGDRIGIVTFAGNSTVQCPLTQDYSFVRMALAGIDTSSNSRGGTQIGDAVRKALDEVFDNQSRKYKDIILITDGGEHEEYDSFPVEAAGRAGEEGVRIIAIGLGDDKAGSRIPITGPNGEKTFLKYKGREVWTKLDSDILRQVVYATEGGKYLSVGPGSTFNLDDIYSKLIATAQKRELASSRMIKYDEKFQIFIVFAIILLTAEVFVSERKKIS